MQIGDPNVVCHETGLTTISDFRNMHISLGGEGAPLVPEFHNELWLSARSHGKRHWDHQSALKMD